MNTETLMQIALDLAGFDHVPADSAVYLRGDGIDRILFGLDIGAGELMMAHQLGYDCVIAHHPVGLAHRAWRVFERHIDFMRQAGVPEEAAREAVKKKIEAMQVRGQANNYERVAMAARLLEMPFVNIHCPLDELGRRAMQRTVDEALTADPHIGLGKLAETLAALPEARRAETKVAVRLGDPSDSAGTTVVAHAALTNGGSAVARTYFEHGVNTVVYIHISPEDLRCLRSDGQGQLIVTGHLVGDAFGTVPYIEALRSRGLTVDVLSSVLAHPSWTGMD